MPDCIECGNWAGDEHWRKWCKSCYVAMKRAEEQEAREHIQRLERALANASKSTPSIPADHFGALLQLCHPDKHNGSRLATEITAWLLKLRAQARR